MNCIVKKNKRNLFRRGSRESPLTHTHIHSPSGTNEKDTGVGDIMWRQPRLG